MTGETNIDGIKCYDVTITAKVEDVTYYKERLLVDETEDGRTRKGSIREERKASESIFREREYRIITGDITRL